MPPRKKVRIANPITAKELADLLGVIVTVVIKSLFKKGIMRTVHQIVEPETARALAVDMGYQLSDDDDSPGGQTAGVQKKPINPEGGHEVALPKPEPEPDSDEEIKHR